MTFKCTLFKDGYAYDPIFREAKDELSVIESLEDQEWPLAVWVISEDKTNLL